MNVVFDEEKKISRRSSSNMHSEETGIIGWLLKKGWAKTKKQANIILLIVVVVSVVLSIIFIGSLGSEEVEEKYRYDPETDTELDTL